MHAELYYFWYKLMAFEKSNQKMCKLMAKVWYIFADTFVNPPSWWRQKMTSWWGWRQMNDVMIAASLNWLPLAMWHANHLINSHVIGKSENQTLPKKHATRLYKWNGTFRMFGQIRVISYRYPRWNPWTRSLYHVSPFVKYRHQLFTISFHESLWF